MLEAFERVFSGRSGLDLARDALDVAIVAYVIYRLLLIVRGTRAMQMGTGLGVVFLVYLAAKSLELVTLQSLLQYVLSSLILIVVVVFQNDIRRALIRVGGQAWFGRGRRQEQSRVIDEVVAATTELARHRIGAIIAFEQDANLLEFTKGEGTLVGAAVTRELLVAIFYPEGVNKLHDGAIIIRDLKIERAGVYFPLAEARGLDASLGTRHRAAIGITEETDAVLVVVSEERGTISFCFNGNIVPNLDATALRQTLVGLLETKPGKQHSATPRTTVVPPPPAKLPKESTSTPISAPASVPPPPPAAPATSTPLPKPVQKRTEKAKAEVSHSLEPEVAHAKHVATPMPRTTKSILPGTVHMTHPTPPHPIAAVGARGPRPADGDEKAPSSDRPSFVSVPRDDTPEPASSPSGGSEP
ncbi:MAG TPA: diadenylate cyclase CdaA [Polyangiaceae bacterium]|nr:diadenylate cyclase CdaA [Polyangiaceae bacterium]